jgi:hypothetical protein
MGAMSRSTRIVWTHLENSRMTNEEMIRSRFACLNPMVETAIQLDRRVTVSITVAGYIYLAADGCPTLNIAIDSADMASAQLRGYIEHNALGCSDLKENCGNVYSSDGELVAKVSYNGRVWDLEGTLLQDIDCGDVHAPRGSTPRVYTTNLWIRDQLSSTLTQGEKGAGRKLRFCSSRSLCRLR